MRSFGLLTEKRDEAAALMRTIGAPAQIEPATESGPSGFGLQVAARGDSELTIADFTLAGRWSASIERDLYVVAYSGDPSSTRWSMGDTTRAFDTTAVLLPPGHSTLIVNRVLTVHSIQITPRALLRYAGDFYDAEYVHLNAQPGPARTPEHRRHLSIVLAYARTFAISGALDNVHLAVALKANLAAALLTSFEIAAEQRPWRLTAAGARQTYRRAASYIHDHAREPIAAIDVAREVGQPLELLDDAFRLQTGIDVADYLTLARTIGAHEDLVRSDPGPAELNATATRWGFTSADTLLRHHAQLYPGWPRFDLDHL